MSDTTHYLIGVGGMIVITLPWVIVAWRRAERDAHKEVVKLTPPRGHSLNATPTKWLSGQFAVRNRWVSIATGAIQILLAALMFGPLDTRLVDELGGYIFVLAWCVGYVTGWTLATAAAARAGAGPRRSATLTTRTSRTYLRGWEACLESAHLAVSTSAFVVAAGLWATDSLDDEQATFWVCLAGVWLVFLVAIRLAERWALHSPPVVDKDLHVARELLISVTVRGLARIQLLWLAIIASVAFTYASPIYDLPSDWNLAPVYLAGAIGLVACIVRTNREDDNTPAPEWYFARTLEPTS